MKKIIYTFLLLISVSINNAQTACDNDVIVVIDRNKVTKQWEIDEGKSICSKKIPNTSISDYLVINLNETAKSEKGIAEWLFKNKSFISFTDSDSFIRKAHLLTNYKLINKIENKIPDPAPFNPVNYEVKLSDFVNSIPDFKSKLYDTYIQFIDSNLDGVIEKHVEVSPSHTDFFSYSVPFFKSIINSYKIDSSEYSNYILNFVLIEDEIGNKLLAFKISKIDKTFMEYYDYSTNPGFIPDLLNQGESIPGQRVLNNSNRI